MCGILGIASSQTIENLSIYLEGVKTMSHRGPDSSGKWHDSNSRVGFAHQRLSIIDLSEKGHQPMSDIDCLNTIIFNGEIYNFSDLYKKLSKKGYKFKSKTDTEVILAAYSEWGPFKNKKGLNLTNDALSFANFIEQKTFNQRMQNYLETGNSEIYFKN